MEPAPGTDTLPFVPAPEPGGPLLLVGRFTPRAVLGQGAFGVVFRAWDPLLEREVALKVPKGEAEGHAERFLREARAASRLKHPGIVAVYEAGRAGEDVYIASEFVAGVTLAERLKSGLPPLLEAATVVRDLAVAVDYAHGEGVVHRDLKPANVMLAGGGRPQVMDFGLARRTDADPSGTDPTATLDGAVVGSPAYMAPEQARGQETTVASDQYALGAVLYELLTGTRAYHGTVAQVLKRVSLGHPPLPPRELHRRVPRDLDAICRKAMHAKVASRYASAGDLARDLTRWLRGEPTHARPIGLLKRIGRYAARRPVAAAAWGVASLATLAAVVTLGLFGQYVIATSRAIEADKRELAGRERELKLAVIDHRREQTRRHIEAGEVVPGMFELLGALKSVTELGDADRKQAVWGDLMATGRRVLPLRRRILEAEEYPQIGGDIGPDGDAMFVGGTGFRSLVSLRTGKVVVEKGPDADHVTFSPDGRTFTSSNGGWEGWRVSDTATGKPVGPEWKRVANEDRLSIDGRRRVRFWNGKECELYDTATDTTIAVIPVEGRASAAFHPANGTLAVAHATMKDHRWSPITLRFYDAETGKPAGEPAQLPANGSTWPSLLYTADGSALFVGWTLWDVATRRPVPVPPVPPAKPDDPQYNLPQLFAYQGPYRGNDGSSSHENDHADALSPDGRTCYYAGKDRLLSLDTRTLRPTFWPNRHHGFIRRFALSPDGRLAVSGADDKLAVLWDAAAGRPLGLPMMHLGAVRSVGFAAGGRLIVTWADGPGHDQTRLWDADTGRLLGHPFPGNYPRVTPDGTTLVTNGGRVWDISGLLPPFRLPAATTALAPLPDGTVWAAGRDESLRRLRPTSTGFEVIETREKFGSVPTLALRSGGKELLVAVGKEVRRLDPATLAPTAPLLTHPTAVTSVAWSADSDRIAVGFGDVWATQQASARRTHLQLWDAVSGRPLLPPLSGGNLAAGFAPDGKALLAIDARRTQATDTPRFQRWEPPALAWAGRILDIRRPIQNNGWDSPTEGYFRPGGKEFVAVERFREDDNSRGPKPSPDGKTYVVVGGNNLAQRHDAATHAKIGEPFGTLVPPKVSDLWAPPSLTAYRPDGRAIVLAEPTEGGNAARAWDVETGQSIGPPVKHFDKPLPQPDSIRINAAAFRPDGAAFATFATDGRVVVWDAATGKPIGPALQYPDFDPKHRYDWSQRMHRPALAWSPDGARLISRRGDEWTLWDVPAGRVVGVVTHQRGEHFNDIVPYFGFDPDGTIRLEGPLAVAPPPDGPALPANNPLCAAVSPDGTLTVVGFADGTARVLDAASGKELGEPIRHDGAVIAVAFSFDGEFLFTAGADRTIRRWPAPHRFPQEPGAIAAWIERTTGVRREFPERAPKFLERDEWKKKYGPAK